MLPSQLYQKMGTACVMRIRRYFIYSGGGDILCFFANQDEIWHSTVHLKFHATSGPNREKKMGRGASKL